jgi:hypothetical protein
MGRQPKPWVADILWAGLFLALFIYSRYYTSGTVSEPVWASLPELPQVTYPESGRTDSRDRDRRTVPPRLPNRDRIAVASDTVSEWWLQAQGWPQWKAEGFVRDRSRWGGVDSALCVRWDSRSEFDWILHPPGPIDLNTVSEDVLYAHPLWRSPQVRAVHRFRSKVRPLRNWDEVFALAPFDSAQKARMTMYFYVGK